MLCPQCGTEQPDDVKFCPKCGQDMGAAPAEAPAPAEAAAPEPVPAAPQPVPTYAPAPTVPMPQVPPAATVQMPPVTPPSAVPPGAPPPGYYAPAAAVQPPGAQPPKKKKGLIIALVILGLLLLCCLVASAVGYFFYAANRDKVVPKPPVTTTTKPAPDTSDDSAEIEAAATVVADYYAAISAGDMDAIGDLLAPDVAAEITPDWYEGWDSSTTFEFTRGILDGDTVTIFGRESVQAYGSGGDGGVKFTLVKSDGSWKIVGWTGADRTQIEGSDTTGSSSGLKSSLTDASARQIVTELLQARQTGNANAIRQLTTEAFQSANGDIWLDGVDNSEYFTAFRITDVSIGGGAATVTVDEEWNSGPETATYTVISKGGALLVDTWN